MDWKGANLRIKSKSTLVLGGGVSSPLAGPQLALGVALARPWRGVRGGVALGLRGPELVLTVRRTGVDADLRALPAVPRAPSLCTLAEKNER